jgi:hypothetical protein
VLNWFNRAIVVIVLVLLVVGGLAVSLLPGLVAGWLRALAGLLEAVGFVAVAAVGVPVALVALLLLVLELRVRRPGAVALAGDSAARLSTETIVQRLRLDVGAVPEVDQVRPTVWPRRGKVDVELAVTTAPAVDVPTKAAEVSQVARDTIEKLGLKLGKLSVNLSHTGRGWPIGGRGTGSAGSPLPLGEGEGEGVKPAG